jgi:hypothetical protein
MIIVPNILEKFLANERQSVTMKNYQHEIASLSMVIGVISVINVISWQYNRHKGGGLLFYQA